MRKFCCGLAAPALFVIALSVIADPAAVLAQSDQPTASEVPALPGGAWALTESHGDWTVTCRLQQQDEAPRRACAFSQQHTDERNQRILAVELKPVGEGATGLMVLPFGLALQDGIVMQIDERQVGEPLTFSTCLPAGCLVPLTFDAERTQALSKGNDLAISAKAMDGSDATLTISLKGFDSAHLRTRDLLE